MTIFYMPKVSIIMGIYNCSNYLEEAISCISKQTFTDWELIMCDDCSTDNTYEIAFKLSQQDSRIKLIKNEKNLTLAPTLNRCIEIATGKYLARMDGDDICHPERLEKEVQFLEKNAEYAVVSSFMNLFDEKGTYRTVSYKAHPLATDLADKSPFCHAGCIIRKETMVQLGGYDVSEKCHRVEDYDLWVRLYAMGQKGYNIQEALYSMRDDRNANHRRTWQNRCNEARVKRKATRLFSLGVKGYIKSLIPIVKYFLPSFVYKLAHRNLK